jgi:RsiW-degrading membrane proteinase PrsW (M82 family)
MIVVTIMLWLFITISLYFKHSRITQDVWKVILKSTFQGLIAALIVAGFITGFIFVFD